MEGGKGGRKEGRKSVPEGGDWSGPWAPEKGWRRESKGRRGREAQTARAPSRVAARRGAGSRRPGAGAAVPGPDGTGEGGVSLPRSFPPWPTASRPTQAGEAPGLRSGAAVVRGFGGDRRLGATRPSSLLPLSGTSPRWRRLRAHSALGTGCPPREIAGRREENLGDGSRACPLLRVVRGRSRFRPEPCVIFFFLIKYCLYT
jgi:hypothetical protein